MMYFYAAAYAFAILLLAFVMDALTDKPQQFRLYDHSGIFLADFPTLKEAHRAAAAYTAKTGNRAGILEII